MNLDAAAVIWSAPERERAGRPLLVLLHGYASHEGDLFQLSPRLPLAPAIASVRAPLSENGGWAWFSFAERGVTDPSAEEVDEATDAFLEWLDAQDFTSVSLLGFSQGAVVALQAMRARPERFTSVVAISGFVAAGESPGDERLAQLRPPVFWGRGTLDRIIPATAIERTADWLPLHSTPTTRIYENVAHSLSSAELTDITEFLTTNE
jgi:phospholipase/carboxylesterase